MSRKISKKPSVVADRLWADLMELGKFGEIEGGGVTRPALSPADNEAREWFINRCKEAGLEVRVDTMLNVIASVPSKKPGAKVIAAGSHLDTVIRGGRFDGALGVVAALECARCIKENDLDLPFTFECISFTDEEGGYSAGCVGSRAMFGAIEEGEFERVSPVNGRVFAKDIAELGGDVNVDIRRSPDEFACYLELHIEQGPILEDAKKDCGIVTGIVVLERYKVTVVGQAGHAGTMPMHLRKDALLMAAPLFTLLPEWAKEQNPEMVCTVGVVNLVPGGANIIPGECSFTIDMRSSKQEDVDALYARLCDYIKDKDNFSVAQLYKKPGVPMDIKVQALIQEAMDLENYTYLSLPSGAGHDAQSTAPHVPTGMIFVPCKNGVSHNPGEWIEKEQAAAGTQVLLNSILLLASEAE